MKFEELFFGINESTTHLGHVVVDDTADVRFIEAHAKRHGGHDDSELPAHEIVLDAAALGCRHAGVVSLRLPFQRFTDLLPC